MFVTVLALSIKRFVCLNIQFMYDMAYHISVTCIL